MLEKPLTTKKLYTGICPNGRCDWDMGNAYLLNEDVIFAYGRFFVRLPTPLDRYFVNPIVTTASPQDVMFIFEGSEASFDFDYDFDTAKQLTTCLTLGGKNVDLNPENIPLRLNGIASKTIVYECLEGLDTATLSQKDYPIVTSIGDTSFTLSKGKWQVENDTTTIVMRAKGKAIHKIAYVGTLHNNPKEFYPYSCDDFIIDEDEKTKANLSHGYPTSRILSIYSIDSINGRKDYPKLKLRKF